MPKKVTAEKDSHHKYCDYEKNQTDCPHYKLSDYDNFKTCIFCAWAGQCLFLDDR